MQRNNFVEVAKYSRLKPVTINECVLRVTKKALIASRQAVLMLGAPRYVEYYINYDDKEIAIKPAKRGKGRKVTNGYAYLQGRRFMEFIKQYGRGVRCFNAERLDDGVLVFAFEEDVCGQ